MRELREGCWLVRNILAIVWVRSIQEQSPVLRSVSK